MPEPRLRPARLRAGVAAAVLAALLLIQSAAAAAAPGAYVRLTDLSCRASRGAQAAAETVADERAELHASLTLPGSWALFTFSAANDGDRSVRLVRAAQRDQTPPDVDVSFGISGADEGETLAPGQTCTVSVLVRRAEDAASTEEDGAFSLALYYAAEETVPATGDGGLSAAVCGAAAAGLLLLMLAERRKGRGAV